MELGHALAKMAFKISIIFNNVQFVTLPAVLVIQKVCATLMNNVLTAESLLMKKLGNQQ